MRIGAILLLLAIGTFAMGQGRVPDHKPTVQGTLALPSSLGNKVFAVLTSPLGMFELSVQVPIWKGLGIGAGAKTMGWELKKNAFSQLSTQGDASRWSWYAKAQYAHYTSPVTFYEINARVGSSTWKWDCSTCPEDVRQQSLHWSSGVGYYVHASKNLAFGLTLGYETDASTFTPDVLCLENFPGYEQRSGPYDFFVLGLGFSTRFEKSEEERW